VGGGEVLCTVRDSIHAMYLCAILPLHHGPIPRTTRGMCTPLASCVEGTDGAGGRAVHAVAVATSTKRRTAAYMSDMEGKWVRTLHPASATFSWFHLGKNKLGRTSRTMCLLG
jgi:hypothetical protein